MTGHLVFRLVGQLVSECFGCLCGRSVSLLGGLSFYLLLGLGLMFSWLLLVFCYARQRAKWEGLSYSAVHGCGPQEFSLGRLEAAASVV